MGQSFSPRFKLPAEPTIALLVGVIYVESSARYSGGEDADEKEAIGWTFVNIAYYAKHKPEGKKHCYNLDMGNGTLLSAIAKKSRAHSSSAWNEIMNGSRLKPLTALQALAPSDKAHLELCVDAADAIGAHAQGPHALSTLAGRVPVEFNKAHDSPANRKRGEKIGRLRSHTFYAFKPGRECD
jgi:hypothetical protein